MIISVDPAALQRLREAGGEPLVERMVALFLENTPQRLATCRVGTERRDWPAVERAAHSMKSSAAYMGLQELRDAAHRIEDAARVGGDPSLGVQIDDLIHAFPVFRTALLAAVG